MDLFYSLLYINGLPVHYNVLYLKEAYLFEPVFNPHDDLDAPFFAVRGTREGWQFKDLQDRDVQDQAVEEIELFLQKKHPQTV